MFSDISCFSDYLYNLVLSILSQCVMSAKIMEDSNYMIPVSKGQKAVRACTIRRLNLGHAKYEKVAIYAVNQRISNILRIAEAA